MTDESRTQIMFEHLDGKLDTIQEGLDKLADVPVRLDRIEKQLVHVKSDVTVIKQVVREHSSDIAKLKAQAHSH